MTDLVYNDRDRNIAVYRGDALDILRVLPSNSVHSLVTDPPAGISFMSKGWDDDKGGRDGWIAWLAEIMREVLRTLKPGAHGLVWALPRTSHWTATALENAGFEVRDIVMHIFGTGFPKSLNVSKSIDKLHGAEREVTGGYKAGSIGYCGGASGHVEITAAATDDAKRWDGWGTALKPAAEHWILVRKPLTSTIAANVIEHGVGAINIDASRVGESAPVPDADGNARPAKGRFPANVMFSHDGQCDHNECVTGCPVHALDQQSGVLTSGTIAPHHKSTGGGNKSMSGKNYPRTGAAHAFEGSTGGASRFFYCGKVSGSARSAEGQSVYNDHPTVKTVELMRYLVQLVTPPGHDSVVLDPFAGSGSTSVACVGLETGFIGIEREMKYIDIIKSRLDAATQQGKLDLFDAKSAGN